MSKQVEALSSERGEVKTEMEHSAEELRVLYGAAL